jgi:uncharacterized membrane protein YwaF
MCGVWCSWSLFWVICIFLIAHTRFLPSSRSFWYVVVVVVVVVIVIAVALVVGGGDGWLVGSIRLVGWRTSRK